MLKSHLTHLQSEGFSLQAIDQLQDWGVRSIVRSEAKNLNITYQGQNPSGLWFPFQQSYGQLRTDNFFLKYLSPACMETRPWNPSAQVVTEGYKDAAAGTLMGGIPTAAIAGVTHYRSLPQLGQTVIFDSDAATNPNVFTALVRAAIYLGGKAIAIPQDFGSKAGLCEFFKEFSIQDQPDAYQELLATAMTPLEMLFYLPSQWRGLSVAQLEECAKKITTLVYDFPEIINDRRSIEHFCNHVSKCCGYPFHSLMQRFPVRVVRSRQRDHSINKFVEIPIEICLARSNRDALCGVSGNRNCTAFNVAADLCGVSNLLDTWGQKYSDPLPIFRRFGALSEINEREMESVWRSAQSNSCKPALPVASIERNISYWQYQKR
jgi:hypothetical protein